MRTDDPTFARQPGAAPVRRRDLLSGIVASAVALPVVQTACSATTAVPDVAGPVLRLSNFPTLREAAARWQQTGGTLIVDRDQRETTPVTVDCLPDLSYRLACEGAHTLSYGGPQFHWFLCILSNHGGNPVWIDGPLTIDGRNGCSIPLFVRFENVAGDRRRSLTIDGITIVNARMKRGVSAVDGSRTNAYGATGLAVSGGFESVALRHVSITGVTREAGAGDPGHQGCAGIAVTGAFDRPASAKHVTIEDFSVSAVDSDEPPGSPRRGDMDGVLVFQGPEQDGTRPLIQRGVIRNAAGRAIKIFAPGGGGTTRDLTIYRSVHGNTGGSNDIAHQHGDGLIENIVFHYSGDAHSQPTTSIGMSSGTPRTPGFPFATGVIRNIVIHDTTGHLKRAVATFFYNIANDVAPRRYAMRQVTDEGSAECLFRPGVLGAFGPAQIDIDDVKVRLTEGLLASEDITPMLTVVARRFVNRAARPVPFKVAYNGNVAPPRYGGKLNADASVTGLIR